MNNNQIGNFENVYIAGNCMIVDNMILVFNDAGEITFSNIGNISTAGECHYEVYESGNKLKLSNGRFPGELFGGAVNKTLYVFYRE